MLPQLGTLDLSSLLSFGRQLISHQQPVEAQLYGCKVLQSVVRLRCIQPLTCHGLFCTSPKCKGWLQFDSNWSTFGAKEQQGFSELVYGAVQEGAQCAIQEGDKCCSTTPPLAQANGFAMLDCAPNPLMLDSNLDSVQAGSAVLEPGIHPRCRAACQPECSWAVRSKTALLLALIFKRAGASLWQSAVPGMLQFGRQSPAHTRTVCVHAPPREPACCASSGCRRASGPPGQHAERMNHAAGQRLWLGSDNPGFWSTAHAASASELQVQACTSSVGQPSVALRFLKNGNT